MRQVEQRSAQTQEENRPQDGEFQLGARSVRSYRNLLSGGDRGSELSIQRSKGKRDGARERRQEQKPGYELALLSGHLNPKRRHSRTTGLSAILLFGKHI